MNETLKGELSFPTEQSKQIVVASLTRWIVDQGFALDYDRTEFSRPWGAFWGIDESQTDIFVSEYFQRLNLSEFSQLSPKILLVEPGKRLSWQYHHRRGEYWTALTPVHVYLSPTDNMPETPSQLLTKDMMLHIPLGTRHRLAGLPTNWGVVAEIWHHTDPNHRSNEQDIVRVSDDFKR